MDSIRGQVAVVTGGGRGIGRAVAESLAACGMSVALFARTAEQLIKAKQACETYGSPVLALPVDVRDASQVKQAADLAQSVLGPVDLLVSNAGVQAALVSPWEDWFDAWWRCIEINLGGALAVAAAVLPGMWERGRGRIVHMNSLSAMQDSGGAYSVSKAGLSRLTGVLAAVGAERGIAVFDVSPGLVRTVMTENSPPWQDLPEEAFTPMSKIVDLVTAIATGKLDRLSGRFIHASDDLDYLVRNTDQIIKRDGRALRLRPGYDNDPLIT